jgi:hypothetical protein
MFDRAGKIRELCSHIRLFLLENARPGESLSLHYEQLKCFAGVLITQVNAMDEFSLIPGASGAYQGPATPTTPTRRPSITREHLQGAYPPRSHQPHMPSDLNGSSYQFYGGNDHTRVPSTMVRPPYTNIGAPPAPMRSQGTFVGTGHYDMSSYGYPAVPTDMGGGPKTPIAAQTYASTRPQAPAVEAPLVPAKRATKIEQTVRASPFGVTCSTLTLCQVWRSHLGASGGSSKAKEAP